MKVQSTFWSQFLHVVGKFLDDDSKVLAQVHQLTGLTLDSYREEQHQALAGLTATLGRLPHAVEIGFQLGKRLPLTAFGAPSLGARVAPTIRDALKFVADFHALVLPLLDYSFSETESEGRFSIGFRYPVDPKAEALLVAGGAAMTEKELGQYSGRGGAIKRLELTPSSQGCEAGYRKHFSIAPETSHQINTMVFDRATLDLPNPLGDPLTFASIVSECVTRVDLQAAGMTVSAKARELVMSSIRQPPSLDQLAAMLKLTPRQLRLFLVKENTNYQNIVRSCRIEYANTLFKNPALSISQIAYRLGYSDLSAFTHSFYRWTGKSPSAFRIEMLSLSASL